MKSGFHKAALAALTILALAFNPSCMKDRPEELPDSLEWNPELAFPLGEDQFGLNSASGFDTSLFEPDTISGLPQWVKESELTMEGVFAFDFSTISDNIDNLNRILFRVNIYNQFPHTVHSQAYFRDGALNVIDSMFVEGPVDTPPGIVNSDGNSIQEGYSRHDAIIGEEGIPPLADAQTILFHATFQLDDLDTALIPAYPTLSLGIETGLMLDLSLEY